MKSKSFIILFTAIGYSSVAQDIHDPGGYERKTNPERIPVSYSYLREADVMWSKRIWRVIDLTEKINLPFKYPSGNSTTDRLNLLDVLKNAILYKGLTAYSYEDDEFTSPITWEKIRERAGAGIDTVEMVDSVPPYNPILVPIERSFSSDKVIGYCIKEEWFFDKQLSEMKVRIIGLAPLIYALDENGNIREGNYRIPLFWVYYPEARKYLANTDAFNRQNNGARFTFDDLFQSRFFASYIIKESNVYDRRIGEYQSGLNALLEAERIKDEIANFEHDMWEY